MRYLLRRHRRPFLNRFKWRSLFSGVLFPLLFVPLISILLSEPRALCLANDEDGSAGGVEGQVGGVRIYDKTSEDSDAGLVEIIYDVPYEKGYLQRRTDWGFIVGLGQWQYLPDNYVSTLNNVVYRDLYHDSFVPMIMLELSAKYNMSLASLKAGFFYGQGARRGSYGGVDQIIDIRQDGLLAGLVLDGFMSEPLIAPYGEVRIVKNDVLESNQKSSFNGVAGLTPGVKLGVLIQLNALEKRTASDGYKEYGLENTFLDIYASSVSTKAASGDPDLDSSMNLGFGLVLEF